MATATTKVLRRNRLARAAACGSVMLCLAAPLQAQTVEQHPAQPLIGRQTAALNAQAFAARPDDPTPFGVTLTGLTLVDAHASGGRLVRPDGAGINTAQGGPTAQNAALRRTLAKYVGQPLSFRLLSAIQTEVTQFYRDNGRSLVSVTVPQQEITSGVVQINVTAFVLAGTTITGADAAATAFLTRQIRVKPGQEVDTDRLLEDVNWLNQNPFRHVSVVFEPGRARDTTNLTLRVESGRTWSAYLGASNSGTRDTGTARLYGGFNISALPWQDQQLSYQFTGAPDSIAQMNLWDTGTQKGYLSHAISYFIPVTTANGFRAKLSFGASHISSYSVPGNGFTSATETTVVDAELAIPLRKTAGRFTLVPELYAKLEYDDYARQQFILGLPFGPEDTTLLKATLGLRAGFNGQMFGKSSRGSADLGLVLGRRDTDGVSSDYAYVKATVKQEIFVTPSSSVALRLAGQSTGDTLHALDQMALGGDSTVRGYDVNAVSGATAFAGGVEYRAPAWTFALAKQEATFRPHVFVDFGMAAQDAPLDDAHMASVGLGGQFEVGRNLVGSVDLAQALSAAGTTKANATSIAFQLTARF